eukprot:TRINITY_DN123977_c0_g1_i1.p1 TRINITY_DN123977_c0_g1~~TRINITY_DN123977_c0_g1_i1.p1  ORF type:complete len:323 (-),score=66.74 TRINITY_DN123977_c0_g1_i1:322-1290(-)
MTLWPFQNVICFSMPYSRSFVAPRLSTAYFLFLLGGAALVLFPLFATFASDNVWVKESSYREQPRVAFANDLLVMMSGEKAADAVGWGTRPELRSLLPREVLVPSVRATALDQNDDGVSDVLKLNVEMPFVESAKEGYRWFFLVAVYNYQLIKKTAEQIGGLVSIDVAAPYLATGVWLKGRVRLRQTLPYRVSQTARTVYAANPLDVDWRSSWAVENHPVTMRAILDRYASRNSTIYLELTAPPVWDFSPRDQFSAQLEMEVPPELIQYVPGSLEVLKFAWMQLLAFLIPAWIILRIIQAFAFENQIVETYVISQLPAKGGG